MVRSSCLLICFLLGVMLLVLPATAYPSANNYYREDNFEPEEIVGMLNRLNDLLQMERKMENYKEEISSGKRGLDMGLTRGYSGALQAKHVLGVAAANYAGGPGRRRRNAH